MLRASNHYKLPISYHGLITAGHLRNVIATINAHVTPRTAPTP